MALRFTVLGSGSAGNASLLEAEGFGLLLDSGLGPRQLARRMALVGASWSHVHAVLLTHTHGDHWNDRTFGHLRRRRIPLYCHRTHHETLTTYGWEFAKLRDAELVRAYEPESELELAAGLRCRPLVLRHDGGATFGFRFHGSGALFGPTWSMAYVADLGSWTPALAQELADVDLLALEFNHDVQLEHASGRSAGLMARVLGDDGHLSNDQAADLLREVLRLSAPGRLRHLVQLHLSRECNHATLAVQAARSILTDDRGTFQVHTACQAEPGPVLTLGSLWERQVKSKASRRAPRSLAPLRAIAMTQPWLPGFES
jgi:phosphoribosyl 1,2-cyclic phosphodiesterase